VAHHPEEALMFRNPTTDVLVVLLIVLLILGPKRLPALGKSLGQGMREFKDSITGDSKHDDDDVVDEERPAITQAAESPASGTTASEPAKADVGSERAS
jgi:sec-independent protein translocase protein TatA